ncbi:hypothetical protein LE190_05185 [Massilia oculi]|uniref:Peptidase n=1 Tax=Massilia hydrophila TaxID=3044279 RepID=A0ABS7Y6K6_9BURK|nr:hypothetical protein [Massilia oculi]MCA1855318.1 hypothetical protein [Massilia oculi]
MRLTIPARHVMAWSVACAIASPGAWATPPAQVFIDRGELHYVGPLSAEANRRAFALYEDGQDKPRILSIRSSGGPTGPGMELGRWVRARGLDVKVMEYCMSSCANYVFTAAPRRVVSNFAVVAYHGGLSSTGFALDDGQEAMLQALPAEQRAPARERLLATLLDTLKPQAEAERQFFAEIGVQQRITTFGQESRNAQYQRPDSIGWTYSVDDFARLGVGPIRVVNPPWRPGFVNASTPVTLLKLD